MKKHVVAAGVSGAVLILVMGGFFLQQTGKEEKTEKTILRIGVALYRGDDPFINNLRSRLEEKAKRYEI
ncbi:MAG: galactose ABC transporter substrate-binding protein, partial [Clostridium sp.]|nr:galactose ABC transporter substrate-binding protein [Clostridium sp.]